MNKGLVVGTVVSTIAVSVLAYIFGKDKTKANSDSIIKINGDNEAAFMSDFANCTSNEAKKYILSIQDYEKDLGLCNNPTADKLNIATDYDTEIKWVVEHAGLSKELCEKLFAAQTAWFIKNGIISMDKPELVNAYRRVWE